MPLKTVYQAQVQYLQILDEQGNLDEALAADVRDDLTDERVVELYKQMLVARELDEAAFKLQRSGRMGTFPQNHGQEAVALGAAAALRKGHDHIVPSYRENAALFHHGLPMHHVLLHWMGDERGNAVPPDVAVSPICIEIGAQCLHAAGWAWAFKLRGEDKVGMVFFGDGATSEGDFHEGMNFAGVLKLPLVFVCQNNGFAISVPISKQSSSRTFAQKALAYDMETIQVDGNDLFAVYKAARDMTRRARDGHGPGFIEALTYRLADHTTADDASRYRAKQDLDAARLREPAVRLRRFLEARGLWDEDRQQAELKRAKATVAEVVQLASKIDPPTAADMFDHTYQTLPPDLARQRDTLRTSGLGLDPDQQTLQPRRAPDRRLVEAY